MTPSQSSLPPIPEDLDLPEEITYTLPHQFYPLGSAPYIHCRDYVWRRTSAGGGIRLDSTREEFSPFVATRRQKEEFERAARLYSQMADQVRAASGVYEGALAEARRVKRRIHRKRILLMQERNRAEAATNELPSLTTRAQQKAEIAQNTKSDLLQEQVMQDLAHIRSVLQSDRRLRGLVANSSFAALVHDGLAFLSEVENA